jgi:hypothetical protein
MRFVGQKQRSIVSPTRRDASIVDLSYCVLFDVFDVRELSARSSPDRTREGVAPRVRRRTRFLATTPGIRVQSERHSFLNLGSGVRRPFGTPFSAQFLMHRGCNELPCNRETYSPSSDAVPASELSKPLTDSEISAILSDFGQAIRGPWNLISFLRIMVASSMNLNRRDKLRNALTPA